jgi:hypothetical protein
MRTHCHIIEHLVAAAKARLEKLQRRRRRRRADDEEDWRGGEGNILNIPEPIIGSKKNLVKGRDPLTKRHRLTATGLQHWIITAGPVVIAIPRLLTRRILPSF